MPPDAVLASFEGVAVAVAEITAGSAPNLTLVALVKEQELAKSDAVFEKAQ